jgi:hypothetical protein
VAKFIETFDKLDPAKWALWRGAAPLNIGEIRNGKLHFLTAYVGLNGYVVLCSAVPYYLANNGVEVEFYITPESCGCISFLISPYKLRGGIPFFVLKNFDEIYFEIDPWSSHNAVARHTRRGIRLARVRKNYPSNVLSGKLRIENKNKVTSCYFNGDKISAFEQLENMNVAIFVTAFPYADMYGNPRVLEAEIDNLSIDDITTASLSLQWTDILWTMMTIVMLMSFSAIIKKLREMRK